MGRRTAIYPLHIAAGAKTVDFGGWDMPIHYGSQIAEHHAVRSDAGICDVSHMTVVDVSGNGATPYLRQLLCNDVNRLKADGQALYSAMLNERGGVLDDLITYRLGAGYRVVVNCATREKDLRWMQAQAKHFEVEVRERSDLSILAVQGPNSVARMKPLLPPGGDALLDSLRPFTSASSGDWFVARTGYTGELGVEIILPASDAQALWQAATEAGVVPVGLGARDTLRLEAGMNLYGSDMDESVTPFESNMGFTVVLEDHEFIGAGALRAQLRAGSSRRLIGLIMTARGVLRAHYPVLSGETRVGEITSGAFSPTLQHAIALARIEPLVTGPLAVEIRGKRLPVLRVTPPFVRNGKRVYKQIDD